jgi:hypothetical protein
MKEKSYRNGINLASRASPSVEKCDQTGFALYEQPSLDTPLQNHSGLLDHRQSLIINYQIQGVKNAHKPHKSIFAIR